MHVPDVSFVFGAIRFAKAPKVKFCRRKGQSKEGGMCGGGRRGHSRRSEAPRISIDSSR